MSRLHKLIIPVVLLLAWRPAVAADLYAAVTQSQTDKVLNDIHYPFSVFDKWFPFQGDAAATDTTVPVDRAKAQEFFAWAEANEKRDPVAEQTMNEVRSFRRSLDEVEESRKLAEKNGVPWNGPSRADVAKWAKLDWPVKIHLAHFALSVAQRPSLALNGEDTTVNDVNLRVGATGELWVHVPVVSCSKTCNIGPISFCCGWSTNWEWRKWATMSVDDIKVTTGAVVHASTSGNVVTLSARISRLRLDYPILRDIPLEGIANSLLASKTIPVINLNDFVASLPFINTRYGIRSAKITGKGELRVDLEMEKRP